MLQHLLFGFLVDSLKVKIPLTAGEVQARMVEAGVKGRCISVKLKRRKSDAPEPYKFLGHGPCDNVSRSVTLNRFTDSLHDLASEAKTLLRAMKIPATQMRGIGISVGTHDCPEDECVLLEGFQQRSLFLRFSGPYWPGIGIPIAV